MGMNLRQLPAQMMQRSMGQSSIQRPPMTQEMPQQMQPQMPMPQQNQVPQQYPGQAGMPAQMGQTPIQSPQVSTNPMTRNTQPIPGRQYAPFLRN